MAANDKYNSIKESTLSAFFSTLKAFFWKAADVVNITLGQAAVKDVDSTPTASSTNLVESGGVKTYVDGAVEANPTVPSGTTPTALSNLKVGNDYFAVPQGGSTPLSTDVETDKNDNTKASTPKSVYDFVGNPIVGVSVPNPYDGTVIFTQKNGDTITLDLNHVHLQYAAKELVETAQPAGGMAPNTLYNLGTLSGAVTFTFAAPTDLTMRNEYMLTFDSGSPAAVPTWPNSITSWSGNCLSNGVPDIKASKHYEVSVVGAYGVISEF